MFALSLAIPAGSAAASQSPIPDVSAGLAALRDGRFQEAGGRFSRLADSHPAAPEGPFFEAFHAWWELLDHAGDGAEAALRSRMEEKLSESARRARQLTAAGGPDRVRGLIFLGTSLLMEAQSRAARGSHVSAASAVRQGHRALQDALRVEPGAPDALFAMGTYNYYAANLPMLVKGLRFFLMIPGGDESEGISQLERAAGASPLFGTESLILLSHVFSGGYEEDHPRALEYLRQAARRHPGSPVISLALADLLFDLGRFGESRRLAESTLDAVRASPDYPRSLERRARYRTAACLLESHDPVSALETIDEALGSIRRPPPHEARRWGAILAAAGRETGRPELFERHVASLGLPDAEILSLKRRMRASAADPVAAPRAAALHEAARGGRREACRRLEALLASNPGQARLHYDLGRLLQQEGQLDQARPHLRLAAQAGERLAGDLPGWALLRLGWELESSGRRAEALRLFEKASGLRHFGFRPAALQRVARPGADQPEG